jgi:hypothetical protein
LHVRRAWDQSTWIASDDRVRGGQSQSHLEVVSGGPDGTPSVATFSGHLDITTLGGAGFASQRTVDDFPAQDISGSASLVLDIAKTDGKRYVLVCKNDVQPKRPDGREQSTVSWEYDFKPEAGFQGRLEMPLDDFKPTYRGRPKPDATPVDWSEVKRFSILMRRFVLALFTVSRSWPWGPDTLRSFFGEQEGDFSISIRSISASEQDSAAVSSSDIELDNKMKIIPDATPSGLDSVPTRKPWWKRIFCL